MRRDTRRKPKSREKKDVGCLCQYIINTDNSKGK